MVINNVQAPVAKEVPYLHENGVDRREDPYYWLKDRENPDVTAYLTAENDYCTKVMAPFEELQETLFKEIVGRIKQDDDSVPYHKNGYWYYYRFESGKEYPIYERKTALNGPAALLLDLNIMAKGYAYYNIASLQVSPDNHLLAFSEDTVSRRIYTIKFKDLDSGEILEDTIPGTSGAIAWANDNRTLFYTLLDKETLRPFQVKKHVLGTPVSNDEVVFEEMDATFYVNLSRSKNGKFILLGSFATLTNEYRYINADRPDMDWLIFEPRNRTEEVEYFPEQVGEYWYIRTNYQARNFCIMRCRIGHTGRSNWELVVKNRDEVLVEDFDIFSDYLVLTERKAGITGFQVFPFSGTPFDIPFEEEARMVHASNNAEMNTTVFRFSYQSMTTPPSVFDVDLKTGTKQLLKQNEVVGDFSPSYYTSERIMVKVRDGVNVPVSLVYKTDMKSTNGNPLLLYGYGAYGISMDPYFSHSRLSLLDRGFVFAIAHIRGGEEMGRVWYEMGRQLHKKNSFTDFIDVAEFLVKHGYANKEKLFAMGGSAGGLLMGAVMNMRPDLWKGVIAAVPFVDVLSTMLDDTIPLTTGEYDEWGNPNEPHYYDYIKSYSPYDNIQETDYPNLLITTGLHDSQVQYWEPAKWMARLRKMNRSNNVLLLKTNMETGHSGDSGRFERFKETAFDYSFLIALANLDQ